MKKKITLLAAALMLIATGVSASSMNGDYKGNPIVKLKSNGIIIDSGEVPAIIYDDKTMVPIAALRNLGADVTWDQYSYSVDVKLPKSNVNYYKTESYFMKFYKEVQDLGTNINQVSFLTKIFNSQIGDTTYKSIPTISQFIDNDLQGYDRLFGEFKTNMSYFSDQDKKDTFNIFQQYLTATDNYKNMIGSLKKYYENGKSQDDFQKYLDFDKAGYDNSSAGVKMTNEKFNQHYNNSQQ